MTKAPLLIPTASGLYCPAGDFYIDPVRAVDRAVITHAHADHARRGMRGYLATKGTAAALAARLGKVSVQVLGFEEGLQIGGVRLSFHPSGHLPGAAQLRVEGPGGVWVVTGDYKTEDDGLAEAYAPVPCDVFLSECTFGLPLFHWQGQDVVAAEMAAWWAQSAGADQVPVLAAYSLGKAQRLLHMLAGRGPGPILAHPVIAEMTDRLRAVGYPLPPLPAWPGGAPPQGALLLAPPGARGAAWGESLGGSHWADASGWNAVRRKGRTGGFVLSDHADWPGLCGAVATSGAGAVHLVHGFTEAFARYLRETGRTAAPWPEEKRGGW